MILQLEHHFAIWEMFKNTGPQEQTLLDHAINLQRQSQVRPALLLRSFWWRPYELVGGNQFVKRIRHSAGITERISLDESYLHQGNR